MQGSPQKELTRKNAMPSAGRPQMLRSAKIGPRCPAISESVQLQFDVVLLTTPIVLHDNEAFSSLQKVPYASKRAQLMSGCSVPGRRNVGVIHGDLSTLRLVKLLTLVLDHPLRYGSHG